jgi:uncharacterized membrane protein
VKTWHDEHLDQSSATDRLADWITSKVGSMWSVYFHAIWFTSWMLALEPRPWPTLTLIVSLEAIFLASFMLISQNRADARAKVQAQHQADHIESELKALREEIRRAHD